MSSTQLSVLRNILATHCRVIATDLPGSGRSEPQLLVYPITFYDDDTRSFAALLEHLGVSQTHLVGWSDGSENALLMAILAPTLARSVVTWGSSGSLPESTRPLLEFISNVIDHPIKSMQGFSDYLKAAYGETYAHILINHWTGTLSAIIDNGGDISRSRAQDITCPVLLIVGENDVLIPPALVAELATHIPNAELWTVPNAGHDTHENQPEKFTQTILDWLKRH